jgi:hypothetical protein
MPETRPPTKPDFRGVSTPLGAFYPPHAWIEVATSSSPFQSLSQGDEDIAAPSKAQGRGGDVLVAVAKS